MIEVAEEEKGGVVLWKAGRRGGAAEGSVFGVGVGLRGCCFGRWLV